MRKTKNRLATTLIGIILLMTVPNQQAKALGVTEVIRQGVKRAIKALDLKIQRLQNKTIGLQNVAKAIENKMSKLRLKEIGDWAERQRQQYKKFYDDLWKVRNAVATYQRVRFILKRQEQIVDEYRFTWHMVRQDKHFSKSEIDYMYRVYTGILNESINNMEQVLLVINVFKVQMTDGQRLAIINKAGDSIEKNYTDLKQFNNQNRQLSLNRSKDELEIEAVKKLYGIE